MLVRRAEILSPLHGYAVSSLRRLRIERLFTLLFDPPGLYSRWVSLVNTYSVHGKPSHDARILAAALENGLTKILTFNVDDFKRFSAAGITTLDPRAL